MLEVAGLGVTWWTMPGECSEPVADKVGAAMVSGGAAVVSQSVSLSG
ncbi:MAG TPA: hypothetical protein PLV68_01490 [Ilumatobacteraceae bacterium]|nr:hypothetical protein [Ilumatobacteraceae bacterium]